jgi:hypothetical protein
LFRHREVAVPADSDQFQFQSFLGQIRLNARSPGGLLDHTKYFTGESRNSYFRRRVEIIFLKAVCG